MKFKLTLKKQERPRPFFSTPPDYDLLLNGEKVDTIYFNMTGYLGSLPQPSGTPFHLGEKGISAYRQEIARINREAKEAA